MAKGAVPAEHAVPAVPTEHSVPVPTVPAVPVPAMPPVPTVPAVPAVPAESAEVAVTAVLAVPTMPAVFTMPAVPAVPAVPATPANPAEHAVPAVLACVPLVVSVPAADLIVSPRATTLAMPAPKPAVSGRSVLPTGLVVQVTLALEACVWVRTGEGSAETPSDCRADESGTATCCTGRLWGSVDSVEM